MTDAIQNEDLKQIVDRILCLEEDKAEVAADIKQVYSEAKGRGFDVKALKHVVKQMKRSKAERDEEKAMFNTYENALGIE